MLFLRQSTASQIKIGPFVDSSDGVTPEESLTISSGDIKLSKNGGTMASSSDSGVHDADGWYTTTLGTGDTDTVGRLQLSCYESGALPVFGEFMVLEEEVYDMWYESGVTPGVKISRSAGEIIPATVDTGTFTPTATQFESSDITENAIDHYKDRGIIFTSGNLAHQFALITAYALISGKGKFTVDGFTSPPSGGDPFVII
jgi:hypothetical protein